MLPLLRGHSKSLGAFAQGFSSSLRGTIAFLTAKHQETKYEPIPLQGGPPNANGTLGRNSGRRRRERPRGPYWTLHRNSCAICHHRLRDTIDAQLGLPAIQPTGDVAAIGKLTGEDVDAEQQTEEENEETRIHVPAQTDCEEECRYCYFCISEALTLQAKTVADGEKRRQGSETQRKEGQVPDRTIKGWDCLRCGGEVWSCIRVTT